MTDCAAAFLEACELDVLALKPGNVSVGFPGHGMTAADFRASARAAVGPLCDPGLGVGERVYRAMAATWEAVGCNTNLGILLLAAPLIQAAQHVLPGESGTQRLRRCLASLSREDADWAYRAIRLAKPAGLGKSPRHDVAQAPAVSLLAAMHEAAARDRIARQYVNGYADVLAVGLPALKAGRRRWGDEAAALSWAFLTFLATFPDSHILRKYGPASAEAVRLQAATCLDNLERCADWAAARSLLADLDGLLKSVAINPGTSADLSVATWLVERLGLEISDSPRGTAEDSAPGRAFWQAEPNSLHP